MTLVEDVYSVTRAFPSDERFGLTSQLRRAAVSIASNIGEGKRRRRDRTFAYFLDVALGSQGELEVQLEIAHRLRYCSAEDYDRLAERTASVGRMLSGLKSTVRGGNE
jgi:four helix bundle protein